jgi:hypothetical protein
MSGNNRSKLADAYGVIVWVLIAVGIAAVIWDVSAQYARRSSYTVEDASAERQSTTTRVKSACVGLRGDPLLECVVEHVESARDQERSAYDLEAQQSVADSTFWVMLLGLGSLTLAAFGIWYVRETLLATREGNAEMVAETRRIGEAQVRCYLSFDWVKVTYRSDGLIDLCVQIRNAGQSPARDVRLAYELTLQILKKGGGRQTISGLIGGNSSRFEIPATSEFLFPSQASSEGVNDEVLGVLDAGEKVSILVALTLTWLDVFGTKVDRKRDFARINLPKIDEETVINPVEHEASAIISEISKRKRKGEWSGD